MEKLAGYVEHIIYRNTDNGYTVPVSYTHLQEELNFKKDPESMNKEELTKLIADIQKKMQRAAADLNFEAAAEYRDQMLQLKTMLQDL